MLRKKESPDIGLARPLFSQQMQKDALKDLLSCEIVQFRTALPSARHKSFPFLSSRKVAHFLTGQKTDEIMCIKK